MLLHFASRPSLSVEDDLIDRRSGRLQPFSLRTRTTILIADSVSLWPFCRLVPIVPLLPFGPLHPGVRFNEICRKNATNGKTIAAKSRDNKVEMKLKMKREATGSVHICMYMKVHALVHTCICRKCDWRPFCLYVWAVMSFVYITKLKGKLSIGNLKFI